MSLFALRLGFCSYILPNRDMAESHKTSSTGPTEFPHLANAPITEAVVDFKARLPADFDLSAFKSLESRLAGRFPRVEERKELRLVIGAAGSPPPNLKESSLVGFFFYSADGTTIAQFRRDGFTFNRLKPYTDWADIFGQASTLWRLYAETAREVEVTRIATRYVNRMEFPAAVGLERFLHMRPVLPAAWPHVLPGAVMRVKLLEANGVAANVVLAIEELTGVAYNSVIFDIDAFWRIGHKMETDELLEHFLKLRAMKNKVFFTGLTQEAINLFK